MLAELRSRGTIAAAKAEIDAVSTTQNCFNSAEVLLQTQVLFRHIYICATSSRFKGTDRILRLCRLYKSTPQVPCFNGKNPPYYSSIALYELGSELGINATSYTLRPGSSLGGEAV